MSKMNAFYFLDDYYALIFKFNWLCALKQHQMVLFERALYRY